MSEITDVQVRLPGQYFKKLLLEVKEQSEEIGKQMALAFGQGMTSATIFFNSISPFSKQCLQGALEKMGCKVLIFEIESGYAVDVDFSESILIEAFGFDEEED